MDEIEDNIISRNIKGIQLSAVCFIMNYLELQFDGGQLQILCNSSIQDHLGEIEWMEEGFKDRICGFITNIVAEVEITRDSLTITFENKAKIIASLIDGCHGEAILFWPHGWQSGGRDHSLVVI